MSKDEASEVRHGYVLMVGNQPVRVTEFSEDAEAFVATLPEYGHTFNRVRLALHTTPEPEFFVRAVTSGANGLGRFGPFVSQHRAESALMLLMRSGSAHSGAVTIGPDVIKKAPLSPSDVVKGQDVYVLVQNGLTHKGSAYITIPHVQGLTFSEAVAEEWLEENDLNDYYVTRFQEEK